MPLPSLLSSVNHAFVGNVVSYSFFCVLYDKYSKGHNEELEFILAIWPK